MNNGFTKTYRGTSFIVLTFILTACGQTAPIAQRLPNRDVPLTTTVQEAVRQTPDLAIPDSPAASPSPVVLASPAASPSPVVLASPAASVTPPVPAITATPVPEANPIAIATPPPEVTPVPTATPGTTPEPAPVPPAAKIVGDYRLLEVAAHLANLSEAEYQLIQQKWLGSSEEACNFFVITALCESGYCKTSKPFYRAADFGEYFKANGWIEVSLSDAKAYLKNKSMLDLVAQRGSLSGSGMGHIGIPFDLDERNQLQVAQGNYHVSSHQVERWVDSFAGHFHFFVNLPLTAP